MKALTSTNKPKDPVLVMSCRFLHHYSNNDSFSCPLGCQKFWECVLFQGAQYGACECTELGLIARCIVRAISCPSGAEDVCGGWVRLRWWAVNGELCKWKPGWCSSVGKSGGHLNIQPQGQHSNSTPPPQHATQGERKWQNGKERTGKNLHFNVPVGITLDKSSEYEGPRNPTGRHKTTCNSRCSENNILLGKKLEQYRKRSKSAMLREQRKFRSLEWREIHVGKWKHLAGYILLYPTDKLLEHQEQKN